jgi:hypothetical protein
MPSRLAALVITSSSERTRKGLSPMSSRIIVVGVPLFPAVVDADELA